MATIANHRRSPPKFGREGTNDLGDGAEVLYIPRFLKKDVADGCFEQLLQDIRWQQRRIVVFGREVAQPRLTAYQADDSILSYSYSGITLVPDSWNETVYNIKGQIQAATTNQFNSCLLNRYRSGNDSLAYHSDNEREYGSTPVIASLSLGSMRDFVLRRNADHRDKIVFKLASGDLLVLRGTVQQYWMHSVPRRKGAANEERINLTFRNVLTSFS